MDYKTHGQVAFEAYCEAVGGLTYDGKPIPSWMELSGAIQIAWVTAAAAVAVQVANELFPNSGVTQTQVNVVHGVQSVK